MRAALRAGIVLSGLMILAALVLAVIAIWSVGSDADRWGGTAALLGFAGFVGCAGCSIGMAEL